MYTFQPTLNPREGVLPEKFGGAYGTLPETLTLQLYFRSKSVIFPTLFQTWSKIWYPVSDLTPDYMVVINIKRGMVLSRNDEEVASSKKHIQFKTRVHKSYPISDQNGQNWYPISDQNG